MPYPVPFLRVVASGPTYGDEAWSCSLAIAPNFGGSISQPEDLGPFVDAWREWFTRAASGISSSARLALVKVNRVGTDGLYSNQDESFYEEIVPNVPGPSAPGTPPQVTCAVTLRTASARGLAHAGRFYPPLVQHNLGADGLIGTTQALQMAESAVILLNDLNDIGVGSVSVLSQVGGGAVKPVTGIEVGRVLDTQRKRRRSLPESYVRADTAVNFQPNP